MKLFRRQREVYNPIPQRVMPPPRTPMDLNQTAIRISAVYRCVSVLATAASQMEGFVKRGTTILPKPTWVATPDPQLSGPAFTEQTVTALALRGEAFWRVYRNSRNEPIAMKNLDPADVDVQVQQDGRIFYKVGDWMYGEDDIKHLRLLRLPGQVRGIGPIQAAKESLIAALSLTDFQNAWFSNPVPPIYLKTDQVLSPALADLYEDRWAEKIAAKRTPILGSGLELKSILLNPADAMFVDVANYSVLEISRLFGVPSHYLNAGIEGSSLTYTNVSDLDRHFIRYSLAGYLLEMEGALDSILPRGQNYEFDPNTLLALNIKERYDNYKLALEAGWMTADEVRQAEGMQPLSNPAKELKQNDTKELDSTNPPLGSSG